MAIPQPLSAFVELRRQLLRAELQAAELVGRSDDAKRIRAEMVGLAVEPLIARGTRVAHGKVRGGFVGHHLSFERQMILARCRLAELEAEVAQWQATHAAGRKG